MSIHVTCPECFSEYGIPERFAGKKIRCKSCGAAIPVTESEAFAPAVPPEDFGPAALPPRHVGSRPAAPPPGPRSGGNKALWWIGGIAGGVVLALLVCCGGPFLLLQRATSSVDVAEYPNLPDFGEPTSPFPVSEIPVPKFPALGPAKAVGDGGVMSYDVDLSGVAGNDGWPGMGMKLRVYLPPGEHAASSLPCVLVAPAGSILLTGQGLDDADYHDETLPYAEAGMAVVSYSLDGGDEELPEESNPLKAAYLRFRAAGAGAVNCRNALEFALAGVPAVDPKKVFAAGHSSGGTATLLAAAHEPRLAGALAYAPATDVVKRMEAAEEIPAMLSGLMFPRLNEFLTQSSPMTHASDVACPVFLYHAKNDENTPFEDSERYVRALETAGKDVTFVIGEADGFEADGGEETADGDGVTEPAVAPPDDPEEAADGSDDATPEAETTAEALDDEEYQGDEEFPDEDYGAGSHYDSMIREGIPKGIEWIKSRTGG